MLLIISRSLFLALSLSLIICASPLTIGLWILLIALCSSWFIGTIFSSWFAIIIFLIYVGGILVIFAYFTALTPNQPIDMLVISSALLVSWFLIITPIIISYHFISPNLTTSIISFSILTSTSILYSPINSLLLLTMATILFLILVAVVKIANITNGPLRPFSYV
jgi:hypothetical protein